MKIRKITAALICTFAMFFLVFSSGCSVIDRLLDKTPENYTEGIKYSKDYEDDILETYDDSVVYGEFSAFGEIVLFCGTGDDFDDIVDFYKEFFEENGITLAEENEEKDEYYARGTFDGYEFKVKIAEPEGEYVEELFENIITLSTRELKEGEQLGRTETPAPSSPVVNQTPAPQPTEQPPQLTQPPGTENETKLATLLDGTWSVDRYSNPDGSWVDWSFYINDESTGTMYYNDMEYGERWWVDFTYSIQEGKLTILFADNVTWNFFAYYDYEALHLIPTDDTSYDYYFYNYGEEDQSGSFTAFGDWMIYDPTDGFIGTLAFWPDGTGYIYNGFDEQTDVFFTWENIDGAITFWDEMGYEIDSFTFSHRHNILEYYSVYYPDEPIFYNRTDHNLLTESYTLSQSNDPGLYGWELDFYDDYSSYALIQNVNGNVEDADSYWYIDQYTGMIWIYINEVYYSYDYHHFVDGLLLWDSDNEYYYEFTLIQ